jgi:hypothetical protein
MTPFSALSVLILEVKSMDKRMHLVALEGPWEGLISVAHSASVLKNRKGGEKA